MPYRALQVLILFEVAICFAIPVYFLFWGVVTLPVSLAGAGAGVRYALIDLLAVVGGCLGVGVLVRVLHFYLARRAISAPNWPIVIILGTLGLASIWVEMTGQFAGFGLDWFSVATMILPTLCAVHILVLAMRKTGGKVVSHAPPNTSLERTREG